MIERDLIGYGGQPPHPRWPGDARVAVQFVLNVEEGGESSVLNGDACSETYLHELAGRPARIGQRASASAIRAWKACMNTAPAPASGASSNFSASAACR